MDKWDQRFLNLARTVGSWSKDPSTKVGAVIAQGKYVLSLGFNGFPPDIEDKEEWLNNREEKYKRVVHAEMNAITVANGGVAGATLYVTPLMPCPLCAKRIIDSGISAVHFEIPDPLPEHWQQPYAETMMLFNTHGIETTCHKLKH
jgi:dCMP deaminase